MKSIGIGSGIEYCEKCESFDCRCNKPGAIKYSGPRDLRIGEPRENGMTHKATESDFSAKEKASTGLTLREKL